ncbi:MAG: methyltransferase domain-containing protein [Acidimicrobiia bacterium]|nr:MAG: methyltransferase domain-containing protein [Acidimicrobiia bacterium]
MTVDRTNRISERYYGTHGTADSQDHERRRIHWLCSQVTGKRVLDVGSSQGIVAILLAREGASVVGAEIDETAHAYALAERGAEPEAVQDRLEFVLTDGSLSPFEDDSFDTVVMGEVIEHLIDPRALVDQARRVLEAGGRLVITTTLGLFPDVDHKEPLLPSDLVDLFGDWFDLNDSTYVAFPDGRFSHIGMSMTLRSSPGDEASRSRFLPPLQELTERCLLDVQRGAEQARLRYLSAAERASSAEAEAQRGRQLLAEARHRLGTARSLPPPEPRPEAIALQIAAAQDRHSDARYEADVLKSWRAARLGMALGGSGSLRGLLGLPRRLGRALHRMPAPKPPIHTDVPTLTATLAGVTRWRERHDFPWIRVLQWGSPAPTFATVARHLPLPEGAGELDAVLEEGIDMLILEPGGQAPPLEAIHAVAAAGVPVVLLASTHDDLGLAPLASLVVAEDPMIAASARRHAGVEVLAVAPCVDVSVANPIGWRRDPEPNVALILPYPDLPSRSLADDHLVAALESRLVVYGTRARLPRRLRRRARPEVTSTRMLAEIAKRHAAVLALPDMYGTEAEFVGAVLSVLAAGTPVITPGSALLSEMLPLDAVLGVASGEEAGGVAERLVADPIERERRGVMGRRPVLSNHTTRQRFERILTALRIPGDTTERISVLLATRRPGFLDRAISNVERQAGVAIELVLVLHGGGFQDAEVERLTTNRPFPVKVVRAPATWTFGDCLNAGLAVTTGEFVTKMDDDDWYGAEHLADLLIAHRFSGADIVGKPAAWLHLEATDQTALRPTWVPERFQRHVAGGTMFMRREVVTRLGFERRHKSVDVSLYRRARDAGCSMYVTHAFGYVLVRHGDHTWKVEDGEMLAGTEHLWEGRRLDLALVDEGGR